jgi:hypothetical protein
MNQPAQQLQLAQRLQLQLDADRAERDDAVGREVRHGTVAGVAGVC